MTPHSQKGKPPTSRSICGHVYLYRYYNTHAIYNIYLSIIYDTYTCPGKCICEFILYKYK